jgi:3',5'-cyclic AMP phosphodiesterase CpdA
MMPTHYRIGLCTDLHFWDTSHCHVGGYGSLQLQPCSDWLFAQLLQEFAAAHLDLVFHLGDATCGGGFFTMPQTAFYESLALVHREFQRLATPVYALPGNHDCPPGGGDWSYFEQLWGGHRGHGHTIDLPGVRLVLLNAQGHDADQIDAARPADPVYGWLHDWELLRLEEALATAGGRPVVLFCHQLLLPWVGNHEPWQPHFYGVRNSGAVLELMARYGNVRAVFQGHAHRFDVQTTMVGAAPCHFVIVPAVIEYPLGWLSLEFLPTQLRLRLEQLSVPELAEISLHSGEGQAWRRGRPDWADLTLAL